MIENFFNTAPSRSDVHVGIGDDGAVVAIPEGYELVITTDTLIADVHFYADTNAFDIGYKSLAVNLSDLAAMGAQPAWFTLAISLPKNDPVWLKDFSAGLFYLANQYKLQLIGGDTTQGPLAITIQAFGFVPHGEAILRSKAKPNDHIYVTGTIGDAALALHDIKRAIAPPESVLTRLMRPEPRIIIGERLRGIANSAIDISDGLAADLGHILRASHMGAIVDIDKLPLSNALQASVTREEALALALTGGDDYELCFTVPAEKQSALEKQLKDIPLSITHIGTMTASTGLHLLYQDGSPYNGPTHGYEHFKLS